MKLQPDRNLSDLSPTLAMYILRRARRHVDDLATDQSERTGPNGARYQAQVIIYTAIANIAQDATR